MKQVILLLAFLYSLSFAEPGDRREYRVDRITGLNVVTDSIDIPPEEALDLENFVLDKFGALHKRFGIKNWNDSLVSPDTIKDIHYVEDKNGDKMLFIATNNYIYEAKSWEDVDSMETWDSLNVNGTGTIIDYTAGSIDSIKDNYVYADTGATEATDDSVSWMLSVRAGDLYQWSDSFNTVTEGDFFMIGDSIYIIDSVISDFKMYVVPSSGSPSGVADTIGDANYRVLKRVTGNPYLSSWNGNLHVALNQGEPWWYDGEEPRLLIYADTGYATNIIATVELDPYSPDSTVWLSDNSVVAIDFVFSGTFSNGDSIKDVGNYFEIDLFIDATVHHFSSEIISVNSDTNRLTISKNTQAPNNYDPPLTTPLYPFYVVNADTSTYRWKVTSPKARGSSDNEANVKDSTKIWKIDEWQGYYFLNGRDAFKRSYIYRNSENTLWIDSSVSVNAKDKYYIAWATLNPDSTAELPEFPHIAYYNTEIYFSQIIFHRNRLYAIGEEITRKQHGTGPASYAFYGDTTNTNRVWFSELGIPNYIPSDYNFDLGGASRDVASISVYSHDDAQAFFVLRDDLYVATNSNIYRISGEPSPGPENLYISQVIQGVGTNQPNGIITTKDNVAYIMNQQGIWLFDGNTIQKISYKIDPLVERYRNSRMTAGKFKDNIFFSYPDSNITVVMHDPTKGFSNWDIGMLVINDQSVAIDSNYFLFARAEDSAYVLQYPRDNSTFTDILTGAVNVNYTVSYRSGWQSMGPWDYARKLNWFYMPYSQSTGNTEVFFFADGDLTDTLQIDTVSATGMILHRARLNDVRGNFHQVFIKSISGGDITLSGYKIECQDTRKER